MQDVFNRPWVYGINDFRSKPESKRNGYYAGGIMNWYRLLRSGQKVSYIDISFKEVVALAMALDSWEQLVRQRYHQK